MALFQKDAEPAGGMNYKGLSKDQLIMLVNSQKSDIDLLNRKLNETSSVVNEKNRLAQQVAALSAENEAYRTKVEALSEEIKALKATSPQEEVTEPGSIAEQAFRVNRVVESAQKAADEYLAKIKEMHDIMSREYSEYEISAKQKADAILKKANAEAEQTTQKARKEVNDIWSALQARFDTYVNGKKQA